MVLWHDGHMNDASTSPNATTSDFEQFRETYVDNVAVLVEGLDSVAAELAVNGDLAAASFFSGVARAVAAFSETHIAIPQ